MDITHFTMSITYGALGEVFAACIVAIGAHAAHKARRSRKKPITPPAIHKKPADHKPRKLHHK